MVALVAYWLVDCSIGRSVCRLVGGDGSSD